MKKLLFLFLAIITCFLLAACGENKEKSNDTTLKENATVVEKEPLNGEDSKEEVEVYSDDSKFVFKASDTVTSVYYHDGDKITGYESRIEYDSYETAILVKDSFLKTTNDNITSIRVEGKCIVIKYGPNEYKDITLSELEQAYKTLQVLKDN